MKNSIVLLLTICIYTKAYGQTDTTSSNGAPLEPSSESLKRVAVEPEPRLKTFSVSESPSAQELADLFVRVSHAEIDPFELIGEVTARGDSATPGLSELLFSQSIRGTMTEVPGDTALRPAAGLPPNKIYAVLCLRGIGSQFAFSALFQAAVGHPDKNVEGLALQSIATDYLHKIQSGDLTASKEPVHLLIRASTRSDESEFLKTQIRRIALDGLKNWVGSSVADTFEPQTVKATDVEIWWEQNEKNLSWKDEKGRFDLQE